MVKYLLLFIQVFCLLSCFPGVAFSDEFYLNHGHKFFPPEVSIKLAKEFPGEKSLLIDLETLMSSYPGFCLGVELRQGRLYLIMRNGVKIIYEDSRPKNFEEKLAAPDLQDMLSQLYRPGGKQEAFRPDYDPGRFRVTAFFSEVYGASAARVRANLILVNFCGLKVMFNSQNGAAKALERVGQELSLLLAKQPKYREYIFPSGGTFLWRNIAGTGRLSPHSWGIAIDLNPRYGAYWRGNKNAGAEAIEKLRDRYPQEIVGLFEKHGFIWGGKWSHYDLMHFEYRPELLHKWQLSQKNPVK